MFSIYLKAALYKKGLNFLIDNSKENATIRIEKINSKVNLYLPTKERIDEKNTFDV